MLYTTVNLHWAQRELPPFPPPPSHFPGTKASISQTTGQTKLLAFFVGYCVTQTDRYYRGNFQLNTAKDFNNSSQKAWQI